MTGAIRNPRGLTLVELVMVTGILAVLTLMIHQTARVQAASSARELARVETQGDLRVWVDRMVSEIREAGYDPRETGGFGILAMQPTELRFTADLDGDGTVGSQAAEYGGFRLNGGVLEAWEGGTSWRPLVFDVNDLTFTYADAAGQPITTAMGALSLVGIEIGAQTKTGGFAGLEAPVLRRRANVELRNDVS